MTENERPLTIHIWRRVCSTNKHYLDSLLEASGKTYFSVVAVITTKQVSIHDTVLEFSKCGTKFNAPVFHDHLCFLSLFEQLCRDQNPIVTFCCLSSASVCKHRLRSPEVPPMAKFFRCAAIMVRYWGIFADVFHVGRVLACLPDTFGLLLSSKVGERKHGPLGASRSPLHSVSQERILFKVIQKEL